MSDKKKPLFKERLGGVSATVWENERKDGSGTFVTATVHRTYKKGDDFKTSDTYSHEQLKLLIEVAKKAERFLAQQQ